MNHNSHQIKESVLQILILRIQSGSDPGFTLNPPELKKLVLFGSRTDVSSCGLTVLRRDGPSEMLSEQHAMLAAANSASIACLSPVNSTSGSPRS